MQRKKLETPDSAPSTETTEPIHTKYRPKALAEVVGQKPIVKSLESMLRDKSRPHTFLFTGPPGTGKTTLARIVAAKFGVEPANMIEVDAASNSGIDDVRAITANLRYQGFGQNPNKAIIIDEAQGLSKQAFDALLKSTEEPPAHVFFFLCSTNPGKIPAALVTRSQNYTLSPVKFDDIMDLLEDVCKAEGYGTEDRILQAVARACDGSPRQALTMLAKVHACDDIEEAEHLLASAMENAEIIDLCRLLIKNELTWPKLVGVLANMGEVPAESIRIMVVNYLNSCLMKARSDKEAMRMLDMLDCFTKPGQPSDKLAPVLLAFGRWIFP